MPYSVIERLCIVESYIHTRSFKSTREIFHEQFPDTSIPAKSTVQKLVQKWRETGSVYNAKRNRLPSVRTPEAIANIQQNIIANFKKSVRTLSQQTGVKRTSCYRVLKSLHCEKASKESTATTTTTNACTPSTSDAIFPQLTPLETVIIKEEIDVDEDYNENSPKHSRSSSHVEFEETCNKREENDPLEENQYFSTNSNISDIDFREVTTHQRRLPELVKPVKENHTSETEKTDKSSAQIQGLSNILRVADSLALNINNILSDDLCNFRDINPTHARRQTPRPSSNKEPPLSDPKSKCTNLEQNLRIHYLKTMIKKEEELINLKIEINRVNLLKENMDMENNREAHLQRMENLKLEHELLKLVLENKKRNFC